MLTLKVTLSLAAVVVLTAADPSWMGKASSSWTEDDARQILNNSPWAKTVTVTVMPLQSEDARRESGNMGQPHGVGFDGIEQKSNLPKVPTSVLDLFKVDNSVRAEPSVTLLLRWESALPVRVAELKSHVMEPPTLEGDGYRLAVYGIPRKIIPKAIHRPWGILWETTSVPETRRKERRETFECRGFPVGRRTGDCLSVSTLSGNLPQRPSHRVRGAGRPRWHRTILQSRRDAVSGQAGTVRNNRSNGRDGHSDDQQSATGLHLRRIHVAHASCITFSLNGRTHEQCCEWLAVFADGVEQGNACRVVGGFR